MLRVNERLAIPLKEFAFTFSRSSGPGGQNVNKVNTKVLLRWNVKDSPSLPDDVRQRFLQAYQRRINSAGELQITSQRFRDQGRNVADCLEKLRCLIEQVAAPPKQRKPTRRTRSSVQRRLQEKRRQSQRKQARKPPRPDD